MCLEEPLCGRWCTRAVAFNEWQLAAEECWFTWLNVCPRLVLGGTAGAVGELGPFSGLPPGWLTCSRLRKVTSSVLRLRSLCCRCTASFDEDASGEGNDVYIKFVNSNILVIISFKSRKVRKIYENARISCQKCISFGGGR